MNYKTDMGRALGKGAAKEGAGDWWISRLTSIALIPLSLAFLWIVGPLFGASHAEVVAAFHNPLCAVLVILFLLVAFKHLADGLKEIIVDYVHGKAMLTSLLIGTKLTCYAFGFSGAFAVAKMAFAG